MSSMTIEEVRAFLAAIEKHPELREELRRYVLTQELLAMPVELHRQGERLDRIEVELADLREAVQALLASSQRHEEWLERLTAIAERQEERLARLEAIAERQEERLSRLEAIAERHEERLARHEEWLERLTRSSERHEELLARHEERLARVEEWLERLTAIAERHERELREVRSELASLSSTVGAMVEADAVDALLAALEGKGIQVPEIPSSIAVNGELDIVARAVETSGRHYWVVVEVKIQLHPRDIRTWLRKLQSRTFRERLAKFGIEPPFLAYLYGQRVYRPAIETARELGIGVLARRGEHVAPAGFVE